MSMMVFKAVTALSVRALASWVSRSASVDATVASATLALPAAASSEMLVALSVAPLSESMAWPSMFSNEADEAPSVAVPAAEPDAAACVAPRGSEAPMEGMDGMAGIIGSGLDVEDGLVGVRGMRHDFGVGLVGRLRLDQVGHLGPEVDHRVLHITLGVRHRVGRVVLELPRRRSERDGVHLDAHPGPLGGRAGRLDLFAGVDVLGLVHRLSRCHPVVHVG